MTTRRKLRVIKAKDREMPIKRRARSKQMPCLVHGAYANLEAHNLDGRSKVVRTLQAINRFLIAELGGEPTTQESLIIERASFKAVRLILMEIEMIKGKNKSPELQSKYLSWSASLRTDLQAIGLQRRQKVVKDLQEYIKQEATEE